MQKKIFSDQSLEELKRTEKKYKSTIIIYTIILLLFTGIVIYMTNKNGFSIFTLFPLIFIPVYIYTLLKLKKVKDEIKTRSVYIRLQNKIKETESN